ncbi:MAG: response regulator [Phycisphaerae bacterium]
MRVLIAEDHRISRFALQALLDKWGFDVVACEDGNQAWEILHQPRGPRLAILDWNMPGMNGMEVCRQVRADNTRDYIYIIMLTARGQKDDIAAGMEAGADDYIIKPFDARELRARLKAARRILDLQSELLGVQDSLRTSQAELAAIFSSAPTSLLLIDRKFQIRNANPAAIELAGQPLEDMVGLRPGMALRCDIGTHSEGGCGAGEECSRCKLREILLDVVTTGARHHRGEANLIVPDQQGNKRELCLHVTSVPLTLGDEEMILVCLEDISERKQAEQDLSSLNQTLETKIEQRTREVRQLLEQKDKFVNQLGHDLKTPLTPLVALLPMAQKRSTDEKVLNILNVAIDNVQFMRSLVEKTLSLARLNSSNVPFEVERVDLLPESRSIISSLACVFQERGFRVHNEIVQPISVMADRVLLREVFHNLLTNAMKYSNGGGDLTIRAYAQGLGMVAIEVQDAGIGMTPEQLSSAFQEFYKADESRHDRASAGLGLSICRAIVCKHGGRITAESPGLGKGSTIRFTMPQGIEESTAADAPARGRSGRVA